MSIIEFKEIPIFKRKRLPCSLTVVDVGARNGVLCGLPELRPWKRDIDVIAIELDDKDFEELRHSETGWKSIRFLDTPLAEREGAVTLHVVPSHKGLSSLYKVNKEAWRRFAFYRKKLNLDEVVEHKLQATTLDTVCTEADILKIDTQGSELDILKGGVNLLKTVSVINIETEYQPLYFNQPLFEDIVKWLCDFELVHVNPVFRESKEGIEPVYAQCFFVRKCIALQKAEALRLVYPWINHKTIADRTVYSLWRFRFTS